MLKPSLSLAGWRTLLLFLWVSPGFFLSAQAPAKNNGDAHTRARKIVLSSLTSEDSLIAEESLRMARYLEAAEVFPATIPVLKSAISQARASVSKGRDPSPWALQAIETLNTLDSDACLSFLHSSGEGLWSWIRPSQLFSIIGWDKAPSFDNIALHVGLSSWTDPEGELLYLAALYKANKDQRLAPSLLFASLPNLPPERLPGIFSFFLEAGLASQGLLLGLRARAERLAGYNRPERTPSRDALLCQALLYRWGMDERAPGMAAELKDESMELPGQLWPLPPGMDDMRMLTGLDIDLALARFWAGIPGLEDLRALSGLESLPEPARLDFLRLFALCEPGKTALSRRLLRAALERVLAQSSKAEKRALLSSLRDAPAAALLPLSWKAVTAESDPLCAAYLLEIYGEKGQSGWDAALDESALPLVRLSAAGMILKFRKGAGRQ